LACDHCYVYESADQSWRSKNKVMALETVRTTAFRIAEHASTHKLGEVKVILHGGEPLLVGPATMRAMLTILSTTIEPVTRLRLGIQTNAVQLSTRFCDLLAEFDVRVGVSLDGYREANDLHRRFANGASSHDKVLQALELLRREEYRHLYAGLLCTIDIRNDPLRVYEALLAEQPPRIDFLLPHATWEQPPLRFIDDPTPYATWLGRIHKRWIDDGRPVRIKTFESISQAARGGRSGTEQFGLEPADLAVVESNGDWEQADSLKASFDGAPVTGLTVFANSVDEVAGLPVIVRRQGGLDLLNPTCQSCAVVKQCGGGLFAHRYSEKRGFDNPSVYCSDLKEFLSAMETTSALSALPERLLTMVARGTNDGDAVRHLAGRQLSINRDLVESVGDELSGHPYAAEGWDLLMELDTLAPKACDLVLSHPYVRPWAVSCLKEATPADDRGYLCSIAAAVAIHAGVTSKLTVPVSADRIHLPTVGTAYLPISQALDTAVLTIEPGRLTFGVAGADLFVDLSNPQQPSWWQPSHRSAPDGMTVLIEDGDPFRDCHNWQPTGRLSPAEADSWVSTIAAAWRLIERETPQYADGLKAGLRAVVPLVPSAGLKASTARHAFGAVAATFASAESLAIMLVHEFHHGKLGAVLDLVDLFDLSNDSKLSVGWRQDLRPVEGVLQGTYAHMAVADVWRCRAAKSGPGQADAEKNYIQYRDWTAAAIETLRGSGALTDLGTCFVDQMAAEMDGWRT
jgi:uncharacterized protein